MTIAKEEKKSKIKLTQLVSASHGAKQDCSFACMYIMYIYIDIRRHTIANSEFILPASETTFHDRDRALFIPRTLKGVTERIVVVESCLFPPSSASLE